MDKEKVIYIIAILVIVIGIVITATLGLNVSLQYTNHKQIDIGLGKEFDNNDIRAIAKEVIDGEITVQKVEIYEDAVSIGVKDITNEQLETLINKINEKYETNNTIDDVQVTEIPNLRLRELIKPYIMPVVISFVLIVAYIIGYIIINNRMGKNINLLEELIKSILIIIGAELVYLSIIAIARIPVDTVTIPNGIIVYAVATIEVLRNLEVKYKKIEK